MEVLELVEQVRYQLPRLGTRKLYHILQKELQTMKIGRDKLFDILRANHLLIEPKPSYHITTNSHHHFNAYQELLAKNKIQCSTTESYAPYANAIAEKGNGILKHVFMIDKFTDNLSDKKKLAKDAINKYNSLRSHYSCYYLTPEQMHKQNKIQIRTYKKLE